MMISIKRIYRNLRRMLRSFRYQLQYLRQEKEAFLNVLNISDEYQLFITNDNFGGTRQYEDNVTKLSPKTVILRRLSYGERSDIIYEVSNLDKGKNFLLSLSDLNEIFRLHFSQITINTLVHTTTIENIFNHVIEYTSFYEEWKIAYDNILNKIPELPFSNIWIAKTAKSALPPNCVFHLGILNSLRSWNFFETPKSVMCYSNTGGFGIDGGISSLIGASLVNKEKVYFGCFGDLAFFYDMNSIGNRHVGNNIRIMLINNGRGTEFRNYNHNGAIFGSEETDQFIAAAHHYGDQSRDLVKHYAEDLGFEYLTASNKEDFLLNKDYFFAPNRLDKALLFEIFTNSQDESDALKVMNTLESSPRGVAKKAIKGMLGDQGTRAVKKFLGH